jgi:hypothetical protein
MAGYDPFSDAVKSRRVFQIVDSPLKGVGVIPQMPQDVPVARRAQKSADDTGFVAVIHRQPFGGSGGAFAYRARTVLGSVDRPVFVGRDAVDLGPACFLGAGFADGSFGAVVGCAAWAGIRGFASGGDSFGGAVNAVLTSVSFVLGAVTPGGRCSWRQRRIRGHYDTFWFSFKTDSRVSR